MLLVGVASIPDNQKYVPYPKGLENYLYSNSLLMQVDDTKKRCVGL